MTGPSDTEILVRWAAEEFVAAGRTDDPGQRAAHCRRATFFTDICRCMETDGPTVPGEAQSEIGRLLSLAFGPPTNAGNGRSDEPQPC